MRIIVYDKYGPPDVLQLREVEKPTPKGNEVMIKIYATTVTAVDCTFRMGKPFFARTYTGLTKPKNPVLGSEFAGEIESTGKDVQLLKEGDQIFGTTPGYGAYTEYLCLPEDGATLTIKPSNIPYEEAAACDGFLTALPFLRDKGKIRKGNKVLINGASGSVGSAAIQLSRYFGAEVTGVCSTANLEMVKSLGADKVIDYTKQDFTKSTESYDIIFDTVGKTTFSSCKRVLKQKGIFLEAGITLAVLPQVLLTSMIGSKKAMIMATGLRPPSKRTKDLIFIRELIETGKIKPMIDRRYPLEQIAEAHRYVDKGHKKGNVIITLK
jgi:NADPH:quinone reductase-like Zn-dependent oxidoreductase